MSAVAFAVPPVSLGVWCHRCEDEVWHCHGVLVVHQDGSTHCLEDPSCRADAVQHGFVGPCEQLLVGCGC
ncbi:MAG TPA: hypothetical protein VGN54_02925 [Mycobacteriales bacterium]|jgi:hypothetical protein|nr:hypothetical protein [Mycobacteriales bacterium]